MEDLGGAIKGADLRDTAGEPLISYNRADGVALVEFVPPGTLTTPSGVVFYKDVVYVSDNATGIIHGYGLDGKELAQAATQLPSGALTGITVGPDEKLYYLDTPAGKIYRVD